MLPPLRVMLVEADNRLAFSTCELSIVKPELINRSTAATPGVVVATLTVGLAPVKLLAAVMVGTTVAASWFWKVMVTLVALAALTRVLVLPAPPRVARLLSAVWMLFCKVEAVLL